MGSPKAAAKLILELCNDHFHPLLAVIVFKIKTSLSRINKLVRNFLNGQIFFAL